MKSFIPVLVTCIIVGCTSHAVAQNYSNLLQDKSLRHWTLPNGNPVEEGWSFDPDGALHLVGKGDNILTQGEYQNFDLWFDFRISEKGNSGIKYRVQKYETSWLGPEYQIQDDAAFPNQAAKHNTASLYDLVDRSNSIFERRYQPINDWSVGRIVVQDNRIRHWMNGNLIIDEHTESPHFSDAVKNSKFKNTEGFGKNCSGKIMLTDHGTEVWYRNVYIRNLNGCAKVP